MDTRDQTALPQLLGDSMRKLLTNTGSGQNPEILALAARQAGILYGSYRRDDVGDPEIFIRAATAILAGYPADIIRGVTDPIGGIQSTEKFRAFPPNPGEVQAMCEDMMRPRRSAAERERRTAEQIAERQRLDAAERPGFDELAARAKAKGWEVGKPGARVHENPDVLIKEAAQRLRDGMPYEISPSLRERIQEGRA